LCHSGVCPGGLTEIVVDPYAFYDLLTVLNEEILSHDPSYVIVDISCLTKLHTVALASFLVSMGRNDTGWILAYSSAEAYSDSASLRRTKGWSDIVVAPLAEAALLSNESAGRGIILAGSEAGRLLVSLSEIEPAGGVVIFAQTVDQPELRINAELINRDILQQLRVARAEQWQQAIVEMLDFDQLEKRIGEEVAIAQENSSPVFLFPFGPKLLVFCAANILMATYPEMSWFVYPVLSAYDVNYSEGSQPTRWYSYSNRELHSEQPMSGVLLE
jgi:hypothetical protein